MLGADGARTLPASMYRDPAVYERERAAVFGHEWLAGVYESGRLSPRHEAGVHQFQQLVRGALARTGKP